MTQEELTILDADIRVDELSPLDQIDDPIHAIRMSERPGEEIAEAGGNRQERHGAPHGRHGRRALCRVAAHADQE